MSQKIYKKVQRKPSHAGQILKSGFIEQYNLGIGTVAELLGMTRVHLSRIINGHSPVTSDIAIRLEILTETPASQWLSIQAKYDGYQLEQTKDFSQYKNILSQWVSSSLSMLPKERQKDSQTKKLLEEASKLAKQLGNKRIVHKPT